MNFDYIARSDMLRRIESLADTFARSGVSRKYAGAFAEAVARNEALSFEITGRNVVLLQRKGVPPEYAIEVLRSGRSMLAVHELWDAGVPMEYALA